MACGLGSRPRPVAVGGLGNNMIDLGSGCEACGLYNSELWMLLGGGSGL